MNRFLNFLHSSIGTLICWCNVLCTQWHCSICSPPCSLSRLVVTWACNEWWEMWSVSLIFWLCSGSPVPSDQFITWMSAPQGGVLTLSPERGQQQPAIQTMPAELLQSNLDTWTPCFVHMGKVLENIVFYSLICDTSNFFICYQWQTQNSRVSMTP